jgi:hypothetical protein
LQEGCNLSMLYFEEPDYTGHKYGIGVFTKIIYIYMFIELPG